MSPDPVTAPDWVTIDEFGRGYAQSHRFITFPLRSSGGALSGLVTLGRAASIPPEAHASVRMRDVAGPLAKVPTAGPTDLLGLRANAGEGGWPRVGCWTATGWPAPSRQPSCRGCSQGLGCRQCAPPEDLTECNRPSSPLNPMSPSTAGGLGVPWSRQMAKGGRSASSLLPPARSESWPAGWSLGPATDTPATALSRHPRFVS